jgi:DNA polymerase III delta prime subunit
LLGAGTRPAWLTATGKPLGSFLFLGPTGVGKTELTLEFTRYLFGGENVFRFDMSEFLHLDNVKLFMGDEMPAEIARAVPESVINCIACMIFEAHRTGRREAYTYLKEFVLEKLAVPDWPLDPMPKLPRMTPPPLPPDC